jgi:hypothetical protein
MRDDRISSATISRRRRREQAADVEELRRELTRVRADIRAKQLVRCCGL